MSGAQKKEVTKEQIESAIAEAKPTSLTQLSKAMGFKGAISGSLAKRIKALVPDIADRLKTNAGTVAVGEGKPDTGATSGAKANNDPEAPGPKSAKNGLTGKGKKMTKTGKPSKTAKAGKPVKEEAKAGKGAKSKTKAPNAAGNPYRAGSAYAVCFDTLARMGTDKPVLRKDLLTAYAKASGKSEKHAGYDLAVILSPAKDGSGHKSSQKNAYWVERLENGLIQLHMAN